MKINITLNRFFCAIVLGLNVAMIMCHDHISLILLIVTLFFAFSIIHKNRLLILVLVVVSLLFIKFKYEYNYRYNTLLSYSHKTSADFTGKVDYIYKNILRVKLDNDFLLTVFLRDSLLKHNINMHDTVSISGRFFPFLPPTNPGQVNDFHFALNHKIIGKIQAQNITIINSYKGYSIKKTAIWIKKKIVNQHNLSLANPFSSMLTALIFGESYTYLDQEIKQLFQDVGLIHALVVSGSQVSLVLSLLISCLSFSQIYRRFQLIFIIPICILFYLITGGGISVLRSIIMALCFLFVRYFLNYQTSSYNILSLTGVIILLIDPFSLFKVGAILSFFTTFSLLFGPALLSKYFPSWLPNFFKNLVSCTIMPWLFSAPILMIYFHQLQVISLFTNLLLIWFIELLVIVGFTSTLIGFFSISLGSLLHQTNWLIMKWIFSVSEFFNFYFDINFSIQYPFFSLIPILGFIMFKFIFNIQFKIHYIFFYITYFYVLNFINFSNTVNLVFFDIGQGDSCLIRYKNKTILVDTGPKYYNALAISKKILAPTLRYYGINTIDYLIITHFDSDHDSNIESLINTFSVKNFVYSGDLNQNDNLTELLSSNSILSHNLCREDKIKLDELELNFLNKCNPPTYLGKNNNSLIFELSYLNHSILFTGDIEKEAEFELINNVGLNLKSDILKVAHHGSKTSSTDLFLKYTMPAFSIVSCGRLNRYKHPYKNVLDRLKSISTVLQTKTSGAIIIDLSKKITIKTFLN